MLSLDVARDEDELLIVTENGYGKRTPMREYPVKGRGTKGVLTVKLTTKKGKLAGALIVREHQELIFISQNGMVQRTAVKGISQMGRPTQGVRVMNLKSGDRVSAVALVVESTNGDAGAAVEGDIAAEEAAAEAAPAEEVKVKAEPKKAKPSRGSSAAAPAAAPKKPARKKAPAAKAARGSRRRSRKPKPKAKPKAAKPKAKATAKPKANPPTVRGAAKQARKK